MKKILLTCLLLFFFSKAFALDFSIGVGYSPHYSIIDLKGVSSGASTEPFRHPPSFTTKFFFDATYLQASFGAMMANIITQDATGKFVAFSGDLFYLDFSAFAKLPLAFGPVTLFPLVGIEYKLDLTYVDANNNDLKAALPSQAQLDLNELWVEGGIGADIALGDRFFFRLQLFAGIKPLSATDKEALSALQSSADATPSLTYFTFNADLLIGVKL